MKKIWLGLGLSGCLLNLAPSVMAQESSNVVLNGKAMDLTVVPQMVNGEPFVPVQDLSKTLGATTQYDGIFKTVSINYHSTLIKVTAGSAYAVTNGNNTYIDQSPTIIQQQMYVPLSFFDNTFGLSAGWNPVTKTLMMNDKYTVNVNGKVLNDEKAISIGNDLYVNLNSLGPLLGAKITPGSNSGSATVEYNGKSWNLNAAASDDPDHWGANGIDDSIYVPLSQLKEKLGARTYVDDTQKQITIMPSTDVHGNTPQPTEPNQVPNQAPVVTIPAGTPNHFPAGTFLFVWKVNRIDNGDVNTIIQQAKQLGVTGVILKFANGSLAGDANSQSYMDQFKQYVGPLKSAGLKVGGWIYQYLTDVDGEVDACSQAVQAGADFIVLDAEGDVSGKGYQVAQFGKELRAKYPTIPIGLSSYAFPDLHASVPFDQYNQFVDVMMPQIYWADMQNPVDSTFAASVAAYKRFNKPIVPTGQLYDTAQPADISKFTTLSMQSNFPSISWWDWDEATSDQLKSIRNQNLNLLAFSFN